MFKKTLFVFALLLLCFAVNAQTQQDSARAETQRLLALNQQLDGTFQIQVVNSREQVEFPLAYLDTILSMRQQNDVVYFYYPYKKNVRIMILPYATIEKKDFARLPRIAYVTQ